MKELEKLKAAIEHLKSENAKLKKDKTSIKRRADYLANKAVEKKREELMIPTGHIEIFDKVVVCVCEAFGLTKEQLTSTLRHQEYTDARAVAFQLLHVNCNLTYNSIGRLFNKDHSTIINGIRHYENLSHTDKHYSRMATAAIANYMAGCNQYTLQEKQLFIGIL